MGFWGPDKEETGGNTMKELQKSLRDQLDQLDDDIEAKQEEIDGAYDAKVQADKEAQMLTGELQSIEDEKFRVERALAALKQSKSSFYTRRMIRK